MASSDLSRREFLATATMAAGAGIASGSLSSVMAAPSDGIVPTPLLDKLTQTPQADRLPLVMRWLSEGPLPLFAEMRASRPMMQIKDVMLVSRYVDVVEVLSHPTVFTARLYKPKMGDFMLTHDDTPTHWRDKAVMSAMLPQADAPTIRSMVNRFAAEAVAKANGQIEVVNEYARMIPARLVQEYFGLDGIDLASLRQWSYWAQYNSFHNLPFNALPNAESVTSHANEAAAALQKYVAGLVTARTQELQTHPERDDIVSRMLKAQLPASIGFGVDRVILNIMALVGAVEVTSQAIVNALDELLRRPQAFAAAATLAVENRFDEVSAYVWEATRFAPVFPYLFRLCEHDFKIAKGTPRETTIAAGVTVLALIQSAAFDEIEFDDPTEFRMDRPAYESFLFGHGYHRCVGEFVARQMIPEAVRVLLSCPNLRRAAGKPGQIDYQGGPFPQSLTLLFDK